MKKFTFLIKPLFFILSLLFSSWLVLKIEKTNPSDVSMDNSLSESKTFPSKLNREKKYLMTLFIQYKYGLMDNKQLEKKLEIFLDPSKK
jgi:hypothetical protein